MKFLIYLLVLIAVASSCIEQKDTENEQPVVELMLPAPCDTLYFGESFTFKMHITDNTGLGNISMDVHNNFGHHNHGNHASCNMDAPKDAVHPYANSWVYALPEDKKEYTFETQIALPDKKSEGVLYDFGDYHFHIYVTDNDGYQVFTTLDVKIFNR